jgi:hypothetical protein
MYAGMCSVLDAKQDQKLTLGLLGIVGWVLITCESSSEGVLLEICVFVTEIEFSIRKEGQI